VPTKRRGVEEGKNRKLRKDTGVGKTVAVVRAVNKQQQSRHSIKWKEQHGKLIGS